ncbi:sensor histidine kinase [Flavobacterium difficile]|uniref:Histidine kinase n=1 Tax=Flavobacterium difficile TaxID=2709659 RepID=A0ABX0I7G8_9FLAO|nr:sensor histidine kinase [Flavobacterium difficile]NHM02128.1 histidine kinase [Flavobacterium difficile]
MQKIIFKIKGHRYFLLFILLFSYFESIQGRLSYERSFTVYLFTPEAAIVQLLSACILFLIIRFLIVKWQISGIIKIKSIVFILITSVLIYFIVMLLLGLFVALIFNTLERNFNTTTLILSSFKNVLDALIYGSFYMTYFYYNRNKWHQKEISRYNQALSESKIMQLKSQINPHFLFNNLNILDQLIEEDKVVASDFLNNFAELYRIVLEVSDKKLIKLEEEIEFANLYFQLIKQKFGNAFVLEFNIKNNVGYIVPMTLQLLIENVIKHNKATEQNPIKIDINIDDKITVTNSFRPKSPSQFSSGKALKNLNVQYEILSNQKIHIVQDEATFLVNIPIIKNLL